MSDKCCASVYDPTIRRSFQCQSAGKYEADGKRYCGTHNPEAVARRRQKASDKWNAKHEAFTAAFDRRKQDETDARRYRWLRERHASDGPDWRVREPSNEVASADLDAAIDDAMNPRYELTDLGKAYRDAMQRGAKLNGGVKAGEGGE